MKPDVIIACAFLLAATFTAHASPLLTAEVAPRNDNEICCFSFAVVGDSHVAKGELSYPANEIFEKIICETGNSDAVFMVHLGDKIAGSDDKEVLMQNYGKYLELAGKSRIPLHHAAGNHEIYGLARNERVHEELFGPLYYSFVHENCRFIVLNTEKIGATGSISGQQAAWLEKTLEESADCKYIFVFMHRPLFSTLFSNNSAIHFKSVKHRDGLAEIFIRHGVNVIFAGHEHLYSVSQKNGVKHVISGGGGGRLHFYPTGGFHHFLLVEVDSDKAVIRAVPVR